MGKAIEAIVAELYARKDQNRLWEPEKVPAGISTRQQGGFTAITVLALLSAGESYQDPRLRDAIDYLAGFPIQGTYALCMRQNVWAKLPAKFNTNLENDTQWLIDGFSEEAGGWDYVQDARSKRQDNSIRQFGALAFWEASKRGLKIQPRYWLRLEEAFLDMQLPDGGWNYTGAGPSTGSMTAAGLATLFITQDVLHAHEMAKLGARKPGRYEQAISDGLAWMDANFSATENPGKNTWLYYYLWGVERVGIASGYKFFGGHDWYREGAAELIRRICRWDQSSRTFRVHSKAGGDKQASSITTDDLDFALMFLSRGRVPVAINKLALGTSTLRVESPDSESRGTVPGWNNRPRDVANLTNWIREKSETDLNWQIVSASLPPEEWLDAPLLYLASHEPLPGMKDLDVESIVRARTEERARALRGEPAPAAQSGEGTSREAANDAASPPTDGSALPPIIQSLKRYLDLGGTLLAVSEGPSKNFARSIEDAGRIMYPQYEWRDLKEDHWAYTLHAPVKSRRPPLRGLSNGVRELIIVAPSGDLPETFQTTDLKQEPAWETMANIYFYASELNRPRARLEKHVSARAPTVGAAGSGAVTIVRAVHDGKWDAEALALPLFAGWIGAERSVNVSVIDHPLATIDKLDAKPVLVMVSGVERREFSDAERQAVKAYVDGGGVILFETVGGRGEFTQAAEEMAATLFAQPIESVLRSRIITGEGLAKAPNLTRLDYRPYAFQVFGARETVARLRGMTMGDQPRVLFSREDISHALLDQPCWGIAGYAPQSARNLLANIVQHGTTEVR